MPAGRPLEPAGNGRPRWMTAHREAARHPWTEPGVQADSSVVLAPGPPHHVTDSPVTIGHRRWLAAGSRAYRPAMRRYLSTAALALALALLVGCTGSGAESAGSDSGGGGGSTVDEAAPGN